MIPPPDERGELRGQVMTAIAEAIIAGSDPAKLRADILAMFHFVPRATLYRWISSGLNTGAIGKRVADRRAKASGTAPRAVTGSALPVASAITEAIEAATGVLRYARGDDAEKPRNPRLTLQASLAVGRLLDTALGLHQALTGARRIEDFHAAVIREIERESPEIAARAMARLRALTTQLEV